MENQQRECFSKRKKFYALINKISEDGCKIYELSLIL